MIKLFLLYSLVSKEEKAPYIQADSQSPNLLEDAELNYYIFVNAAQLTIWILDWLIH